jgi:hypothetical protein
MVLAGAVVAGGAGSAGGETVCGAGGGTGVAGTAVSRASSWRSRLRRQSRLLEIDILAHDTEWQCLGDSMCTRWLPTLNEIDLPAWADELSAISTARKHNRFIEGSTLVTRKTSREVPRLDVI